MLLFYRSSATQLLLWPNFKTSYPSRSQSPTLTGLVFTSNTRPVYTHTVHKVFKARHGTGASAELTEISSTVTNPASNADVNNCNAEQHPSKASVMKRIPIPEQNNDTDVPMGIEEVHKDSNEVQNGSPHTVCKDSIVSGSGASGLKEDGESGLNNGSSTNQCSPNSEPVEKDSGSCFKVPSSSQHGESHSSVTNEQSTNCDDSADGRGSFSEYRCVLTDMPRFLVSHIPKVMLCFVSIMTLYLFPVVHL